MQFLVGMKLEARDRQHASLVCVATIAEVRNREDLLIHFDGWTTSYDYLCQSDSADIHPVGWCEKNNWKLQQPKSEYKGQWSMQYI